MPKTKKVATKSPSDECPIAGPHPMEECQKFKKGAAKFAAVTVPTTKPKSAAAPAKDKGARVNVIAAPTKTVKKKAVPPERRVKPKGDPSDELKGSRFGYLYQ